MTFFSHEHADDWDGTASSSGLRCSQVKEAPNHDEDAAPPSPIRDTEIKDTTKSSDQNESSFAMATDSEEVVKVADAAPETDAACSIQKSDDSATRDVHVCGTCHSMFVSVTRFVEHKRAGCEPRLCTSCARDVILTRGLTLLCASPGCVSSFDSAWSLMNHHETAHGAELCRLSATAHATK